MIRIISSTMVAATLVMSLAGCEKLFQSFGTHVAVVDLLAVARATGRSDAISTQMGAANEQLESQLQELAINMEQQLTAKKTKLGESPAEENQAKLNQLAVKAQQQLQQTKLLAQQKSRQYQAQLLKQFRNEVLSVARPVASRRNASMVLTTSDALLWFDANTDITDEVIAEMRALSNESPQKPMEQDIQAGDGSKAAPDTGQ